MGKNDDSSGFDGCLWITAIGLICLSCLIIASPSILILFVFLLACVLLVAFFIGFDEIKHNKTSRKVAIITTAIVISLVAIFLLFKNFFADNYKLISTIALAVIFLIYCITQMIFNRNKNEDSQKIGSPMKKKKGLMAIKTKYITTVMPFFLFIISIIAFFLLVFYFINVLKFSKLGGWTIAIGIMMIPWGLLIYIGNRIEDKEKKAEYIKKNYRKAFHEFTSTNYWDTDKINDLPYNTFKKVISYPESAWEEYEKEITERERKEFEERMRKQEEERIRKEEAIRKQKEEEREHKRQEAISRRRKHNEKQEELYNAEIKEGKNLYYDIQRGLRDTLNTKYGLPYYYFYNYYPLSKYEKVSSINEDARHYIWHFKDGLNTKGHVHVLSIKINNLFGDNLAGLTFVCIPSSTKETYQKRYESFMENVCEKTGMQNGYDYVTITKEKNPAHLGGTDEMEYECDKEFFKGRKVIVFDDIITRGHSLGTMMEKLEIAGAQVIAAFFLGKTVDAYRGIGESHPWCIDPANTNGIAFYEYGISGEIIGRAINSFK